MLKKIKNFLNSFFKSEKELTDEELLSEINITSTFEYLGPGKSYTAKTLQVAKDEFIGLTFNWNRLFKAFNDCEVVYNGYGCYLVVITDDFQELNKMDRVKEVYKYLVNPPTGLKIAAFSKQERDSMNRRRL